MSQSMEDRLQKSIWDYENHLDHLTQFILHSEGASNDEIEEALIDYRVTEGKITALFYCLYGKQLEQ